MVLRCSECSLQKASLSLSAARSYPRRASAAVSASLWLLRRRAWFARSLCFSSRLISPAPPSAPPPALSPPTLIKGDSTLSAAATATAYGTHSSAPATSFRPMPFPPGRSQSLAPRSNTTSRSIREWRGEMGYAAIAFPRSVSTKSPPAPASSAPMERRHASAAARTWLSGSVGKGKLATLLIPIDLIWRLMPSMGMLRISGGANFRKVSLKCADENSL
mmetsp:Transcript_48225/g.154439  ORF Transcript_48225/g.154439 Transcript_48225/m.154439 type:complete len:219 (-) Transcript_48225:735-1391(-)